MQYTKIPETAFQNIQLNAGVICTSFAPDTGTVTGLLGATTGGMNFTSTPEFSDYGEDIDNCPKNMLELKKLNSIDAKLTGTFVTVTAASAKKLIGAADVDSSDSTKVVPRRDLKDTDFADLWWVGDYSDKNDGSTAGYVAIHMMNALSTGGFQLQSTDKAKGTFGFEFTAHFSMDDQETVPYEVYVKAGS